VAHHLMPVAIAIDRRVALVRAAHASRGSPFFPPRRIALERHDHKVMQFVPAQPNASVLLQAASSPAHGTQIC
jgi:hypothetical protein